MSEVSYSHVLGDWLLELGYTHGFFVAGGGCMHLLEGFRTKFKLVPVVHEVAAGIAVEHFNEVTMCGKAFALVTTGPGFTNLLTAIAGCYSERRELLVIAGQVKTSDLLEGSLRQRGVQEVDGTSLARPISAFATCLKNPICREDFRNIVKSASCPHPGPVVLEICLDVQGAKVERAVLDAVPASGLFQLPVDNLADCTRLSSYAIKISGVLKTAKRPIILIGGLVSRALAWRVLPELERIGIPVMTSTSAIDRVSSDSVVFAGRPSSWGGQRSANMLIAQADVVVGIGMQWDLQQTGFNVAEYAPRAQMYQIYPCQAELNKGHPPITEGILADPNAFLSQIVPKLDWTDCEGWANYVREVRNVLPVVEPANTVREGYISSFHFIHELSKSLHSEDIVALSSSGGSFTGGLQVLEVQRGQFVTTSPAFASMGYAVATSIGVAFAHPGKRVIHIEGDGSFCQNLQELAIIKTNNLPVKLFILENRGYGSIRATQKKFFGGAYVGCDDQTGLGFPDWVQLFKAFGISAEYLKPEDVTPERLASKLAGNEPRAWIVPIDPEQPNFPSVSSRILADGKMASNPLYNQLPPLDELTLKIVGRYLQP